MRTSLTRVIIQVLVVIIAAAIGAYGGYTSVEPIIIETPCEINIENLA